MRKLNEQLDKEVLGDSDGELGFEKIEKYEKIKKKRDWINKKYNPMAMMNIVGREETLGLSQENPVYNYPKNVWKLYNFFRSYHYT